MELYLNSRSYSKDTSNSDLLPSPNFLAKSPNRDKSLSSFEKRKAKLNESIISDVSAADKIELENNRNNNKFLKGSSNFKTRNNMNKGSSQKAKVIYLQK